MDLKKMVKELEYLVKLADEGKLDIGDMVHIMGAMSYLESSVNETYTKYKKNEEKQENPFDWDNIKFLFGSRTDHLDV